MDLMKRGVIDAADRIMRRIIDRPGLKSSLRLVVNSLDPEASRGLVRTLLWRDADVLFTFVGAVPKAANALIIAADEALGQVENKLTPTMRIELTKALLDDIDWETLEGLINRGRRLQQEISPLFDAHRSKGAGEKS